MLVAIAVISIAVIAVVTPLVMWAIPFARSTRIAIAVATLLRSGLRSAFRCRRAFGS
jgi:hypothetical protein